MSCWNGFNSNTKRNIRKAEKDLNVSHCQDAATLYSLFSMTMKNQGNQPGYPPDLIESLVREIMSRKVGTVLTGRDSADRPHCSLLLVWDDQYAYYLSGGTDPELRASGAMPLTMWRAIEHASQFVDTFNFEGSMQQGIDRFLRGFGGTATPYYSIGRGLYSGKIT
jgi:lipid II:glycine glycyltransferase (peptidoglycan interpeptide bridge formation enzyme)